MKSMCLYETLLVVNNDPSPMMAARVIMVELMSRNKALPGDSPDYYLFIYSFISLSIKRKSMF